MSHILKQLVPPGSLGLDKWAMADSNPEEKRNNELVAKGWKMKSLGDAADSLLQAATRLEKDVSKETKYWKQVLSVRDQGWPVSRARSDGIDLGVRLGVGEGMGAKNRRIFPSERLTSA